MKIVDLLNKSLELTEAVLNEDLGNLKKLDPGFLKLIIPNFKRGTLRKYGRESKVDIMPVKSTKEAYDQVFKEDDRTPQDAMGFVLRSGHQQILIAMNNGSNTTRLYLNGPAYNQLETNEERKSKVIADFTDKDSREYTRYGHLANLENFLEVDQTRGVAKRVINNVFTAMKDADTMISMLGIYADTAREEKRSQRQKAQSGVERRIAPKSLKNKWDRDAIERDTRAALRNRLEKFKANRAKQYATPEDFFKDAVNTGYLETINVAGAVYKLNSTDLHFPSLMKTAGGRKDANYIQYRIEKQLSPIIQQLRKEIQPYKDKVSAAAKISNDEVTKAEQELQNKAAELGPKVPPESITIEFALQGGAIVPVKVVPKHASYPLI